MHYQFRTEIQKGGRITIPVVLRKQLDLSVGDAIVLDVHDDDIRLLSTDQIVREVQSLMAPYLVPGTSMSEDLIQERRMDAARESRD